MAMDQLFMSWVDAAKVGAMGIISAVLVYTVTLLKAELRRPKVRPSAKSMIYAFMGFCAICLFAAVGLEVWKMGHDAEIKVQVKAIDTAARDKVVTEISHMPDGNMKTNLLNFTNHICDAVKILGKSVSEQIYWVDQPVPN